MTGVHKVELFFTTAVRYFSHRCEWNNIETCFKCSKTSEFFNYGLRTVLVNKAKRSGSGFTFGSGRDEPEI